MVTVVYKGSDPNLQGFRTQISCDRVKDGYVLPIAIDRIQLALVKDGRHWNSNTFMINDYSNPVTLLHWKVVQTN